MSRISLGLILLAAPALGLAEVVTLECKGTSPAGKQQTITVSYDPAEGWVDDTGSIKRRDGVSTNFLTGIKVFIDRQSGEYETRQTTAGEKYKGTCRQLQNKT
ncbi:MAG TPA: hypothetical protein VMK82_04460 [Steroidobacteraceae bacterium]|nr:hypothetical protein [Steroidobacteraceae bacterium]